MKLKYLGTAAAEGVPAIFCTCENCIAARKLGGKNIRSRSQALINDDLMIDFPADTYWHCIKEGLDLTNIHNYLITHIHGDHFYPTEFAYLKKGFANLPEDQAPYHIWGGSEVVEKATAFAENPRMLGRLVLHELKVFEPTEIGNVTVTALKALHGTQTPFVYILEQENKRLLYAHDTAGLSEDDWAYLQHNMPYFDAVSLDCTNGNRHSHSVSHQGFGDVKELCAKLEEMGCIDSKTKRVVNHFSHHNPNINYTDRAVYEDEGYTMSYDGMVVEI